MPRIGFSTGALFKGDLARAVDACDALALDVIELSALRAHELPSLLRYVREHDLSRFEYVSVHAPTNYKPENEAEIAAQLLEVATTFNWYIVVHPDCFSAIQPWQELGERLCIENMDKRKNCGRTLEELQPLFGALPEARLCFDIAHAHQVDPTMTEAYRILRQFRPRIVQLHVSEVTSSSKHDRISESALRAYQALADQLPKDAAVILETPVDVSEAPHEISLAANIFRPIPVGA